MGRLFVLLWHPAMGRGMWVPAASSLHPRVEVHCCSSAPHTAAVPCCVCIQYSWDLTQGKVTLALITC